MRQVLSASNMRLHLSAGGSRRYRALAELLGGAASRTKAEAVEEPCVRARYMHVTP